MKRLVFLVEGDTEVILVNNHIIPFLYGLGFKNQMNVQTIISNRKLHSKGGNINYSYLKNDVKRIFAQGNVIITTFLDFFRLPNDFPGYTEEASKIGQIENAVKDDLQKYGLSIYPYIQKHELEALMFSSMDGFELVVEDINALANLRELVELNSPEDINGGRDTAPSKRLMSLFPYEKTIDGELILEMVGLDQMKSQCPRFNNWLTKLIRILEQDNE
ncbi:MAG: DUF4276 family protein [Bacteroidales bacterium]